MSRTVSPSREPWDVREADFHAAADERARLVHLLRYAVLAPSSHNTQPWRFEVNPPEVRLRADESRWLRVADADQREFYLSVGCALEHLLIAATHFGYGFDLTYRGEDAGGGAMGPTAATVTLRSNERSDEPRRSALFGAITRRRTSHEMFELTPIPRDAQEELRADAADDALTLHLTGDEATQDRLTELVLEADAMQFADPKWRAELARWIGQGAFGTSWLTSKVGAIAVKYLDMGRRIGREDSRRLISAPLIGVIGAGERRDDDERTRRIMRLRVGQSYARLSLRATKLGIAVQPVSQVLQIPRVRAATRALFPESLGEPQHLFRLGYATKGEGHSPRRPVEEVLQ
jgi:hypothetical protein